MTQGNGIVVDTAGNSYLTGFIEVGDAKATHLDAFVSRVNREGDRLDTLTFGGVGNDIGYGIAMDFSDAAMPVAAIAGATNSSDDFPISGDAFQPKYGGGDSDGLVTKIAINSAKPLLGPRRAP
jgi:hypothetical protein